MFGVHTSDPISQSAEDRGEPNTRDFYSLCVSTTAANDCDIYYTGGTLTSGNYQILPD